MISSHIDRGPNWNYGTEHLFDFGKTFDYNRYIETILYMKTLQSQSGEKAQANFFISVKVLNNLKNYVPARSRSQFVEEVLDKALRKNGFLEALNLGAGAWDAKSHKEDTANFIRSLRESKRWKK